MIMKSRMMVNCRKASRPTTNFWYGENAAAGAAGEVAMGGRFGVVIRPASSPKTRLAPAFRSKTPVSVVERQVSADVARIYFACEINPRHVQAAPPHLPAQQRPAPAAAVHRRRAGARRACGPGAPSPAQSGVLFVLAREDGATMGRLAQALDLAPSAMSGLVQRMEARHWVARRASEVDARTQHVWLLPAGRALLPALNKALGAHQRRAAGRVHAGRAADGGALAGTRADPGRHR